MDEINSDTKVISKTRSGRNWRIGRSGRKPAGKRVDVKSLHTTWEEKEKERLAKKLMKEKEKSMKEEQLEKRRRAALVKKQLRKKAMEKEMAIAKNQGQVITNVQKLKKLSKRDLKLLKKIPIT